MKTSDIGEIKYMAIVWEGERKRTWYFTSLYNDITDAWHDFQNRHLNLRVWDVVKL